ncbi:MAG: anhydro-N-acetylmuramic acid kinase [Gemmatimonadota bacterium]|nr:anhydro-N-acetylmuramic acid kinase [Gemmatimonadota bacterium]
MTELQRAGGLYVGLMSGTSLDGISAAVARFTPRGAQAFDVELLGFHVHEYAPAQRDRMLAAMREGSAREYCRLAVDFGGWLADAAVAVLADAGVSRSDVRAVGSHGQTLWHEPGHSTWQIDAPAVIAERTGISVVSDFRVRDVAAGGQGAPLVPIADALLFGGGQWRALQNIGGIGNVTVVPPNGDLASVRAFDTGPGCGVLDAVVRTLYPQLRFDRDGEIAAGGRVVQLVIDDLMRHPYFAAEPPKSTGRELFDPAYVERFITLCRAQDAGDADILATATAFTAQSIGDAYRRFIPEPVEELLASGGGAKNPVLLRMLRDAVAPLPVAPFDDRYFDGEAKEAVAFALLAHLHLERIPGNVITATGARGPRILGAFTPA